MIDLDRLDPEVREGVERELAVRMRAEDGAFGSTTLRDLLEGDLISAKTVLTRGSVRLYGVLMEWRGCDEPQFLPVSRPLWTALDLPAVEAPDHLAVR